MAGKEQTTDADTPATPTPGANADVAELGYEEARDELTSIVAKLEGGQAPLEESMRLWERGEALAAHCQAWLDGAEKRLDARTSTDGPANAEG